MIEKTALYLHRIKWPEAVHHLILFRGRNGYGRDDRHQDCCRNKGVVSAGNQCVLRRTEAIDEGKDYQ